MGLGDGVALLAGVHDEQGAGQLLHFLHAAQVLLQLGDLAQVLHDFLLRQHVEGAVLLHPLELIQAVHTAPHGLEVGEHAAQPAGVHIVHAHAGSLFLDSLLGLLLGAHEEQGLALLAQLTDEVVGLLQFLHGLLQVDDIDAVALGVDVSGHLGVPTTGLVAEVHAGLQQLLHRYDCHDSCFLLKFSLIFPGASYSPPTRPRPGTGRKISTPRHNALVVYHSFPPNTSIF